MAAPPRSVGGGSAETKAPKKSSKEAGQGVKRSEGDAEAAGKKQGQETAPRRRPLRWFDWTLKALYAISSVILVA